jgi:hypothetical protein
MCLYQEGDTFLSESKIINIAISTDVIKSDANNYKKFSDTLVFKIILQIFLGTKKRDFSPKLLPSGIH